MNAIPPPSVLAGLESAFLSNLTRSLPTNPFLDDEGRRGIARLIDNGAPTRLVGDAYMLAGGLSWIERTRRRFGEEAIRISWHGAERLFEPISGGPANPADEEKKRAFLDAFERLDALARPVFEIKTTMPSLHPQKKWMVPMLQVAFGSFHDALGPLGIHLGHIPFEGGPGADETVTFRHCSISAMELGLRIFLGSEKAPRFILAPGSVAPRQLNHFHRFSIHTIGLPTSFRKIHRMLVDAWSFPLHDECHAALWAAKLDPEERLLGTFLWEACCDTIPRSQRENVQHLINVVGDLDFSFREFEHYFERIRSKLPQETSRKLVSRFEQLRDNFHSTTSPTYGR
ncbi:MAG TPA: hypothetical protein VFX30_10400 [bacterium]|nr:hypothetical protein [bacterium]